MRTRPSVKRSVVLFAAATLAIVLAVGGGAAKVCSMASVNCHLRSAPDWTLEYVAGERGGPFTLPPALQSRVVARGFRFPTDFDFLADGRMLVAERDGVIRLVDRGGVARRPVLDLRGRVGTWVFRGLVALAVDRSASPHELYVAYALAPHGPGEDPASGDPTTVRFSRFTLVDDVVDPASEEVIIGRAARGSCFDRPITADCVPSDRDHIGADIVMLDDGTLFISTGDGGGTERNVTRSRSLDSLAGKILRVDRSGRGLPDNPFWNGNPSSNRSKVWAVGFRNPFRLSLMPDGALVAGDVGLHDYEELDIVERGADYGWPCLEGNRRTPKYMRTTLCEHYYRLGRRQALAPWVQLPHPRWISLTAGTSLRTATALPSVFRSKYLFGDWGTSRLWVVSVGAKGERIPVSHEDPEVVGTGFGGPVRFRVGPDGALYVLSLNVGELRVIRASAGAG